MNSRVPMRALLVAFAASPCVHLYGQVIVEDASLGMRLTLPAGFQEYSEKKLPGKSYIRDSSDMPGAKIVLMVEKMGGVLPNKDVDPARLPKAATVSRIPWKGFELQVVAIPDLSQGITVVTRNVQVPLKPEAIQLRLVGPEVARAEVESILKSVVDSLEGETNWLSDEERAQKLGYVVGAVICLAVFGAFILMRRRRARSQAA